MASLKNEQVDIENELSKLGADPDKAEITFEQVKKCFLEANAMAYAFLNAPDEAKCEYAEILLSNIWVRDNIAQRFRFKPEYQVIADFSKNPTIEQCAPGRIRTCVAHRARDLQSRAFDRSATDAFLIYATPRHSRLPYSAR